MLETLSWGTEPNFYNQLKKRVNKHIDISYYQFLLSNLNFLLTLLECECKKKYFTSIYKEIIWRVWRAIRWWLQFFIYKLECWLIWASIVIQSLKQMIIWYWASSTVTHISGSPASIVAASLSVTLYWLNKIVRIVIDSKRETRKKIKNSFSMVLYFLLNIPLKPSLHHRLLHGG